MRRFTAIFVLLAIGFCSSSCKDPTAKVIAPVSDLGHVDLVLDS